MSTFYIAKKSDLEKRIERHKSGLVEATHNRLPLELIGYEAYLLKDDAKRREKFLKGGKGREQLKNQYKDTFFKIGYKFRK